MLKQSPSRNQRSKGFKVKHTIQICVLIAIVIWLLYQVKHTYDKKVTSENSSRLISDNVQVGHEILKLGRKNLNPREQQVSQENLKHRDEEEEEEEEEDRESKTEENEEEGRGVGDDEIDGHDQDKAEDEEPEQLEDLIDEEDKEREERETLAKETYKGDDTANSVMRNTQSVNSEYEIGVLRAMKVEEHVKNVARDEIQYSSSMRTALNHQKVNKNSIEFHERNVSSDGKNSSKSVIHEWNQNLTLTRSMTQNSDGADREFGFSYGKSEPTIPGKVGEFDVASRTEETSASTNSIENAGIHNGDSNSNVRVDETKETSDLSTTGLVENIENVLIDFSDSSLYQDNKEDHIASETLRETKLGESIS